MDLNNFKNIKGIGLGIVCFEGSELLYNAISEIKDFLSYVVIALQDVSYHGQKISETDKAECYRLKDIGLVDDIIEVKLDTTKEARLQETEKRNLLTETIQQHGCSHALIMDSDEYYTHKSFERAVKEIDENDYEITYCQYINYYHDYEHYLVYPFSQGMYCPFVTKVKYRNAFECFDFTLPSDPTRRYVRPYDRIDKVTDPRTGKVYEKKHYTVDYHIFDWNTIKMHHLSWLRQNIRKKLNAWSSKKCFKDYEDLIDKAVDRFDYFDDSNINEPVNLLFNTPDHKCTVAKFPKQYIHPIVDYKTELKPQPSKKQIVILSESCDLDYISDLEDTIRQTWGQKLKDYDNIKLYFIKQSHSGKNYFDGVDTLYVDVDKKLKEESKAIFDERCHTFTKLVLGIKVLHSMGIDYDYIVKTNTSTWLNIDLLDKFTSYLDNDDMIYGGEILSCYWNFFRYFPNGALMIWNKKYSNLFVEWLDHELKDIYSYEERGGFCDDAMISILTCNRFDRINVDHTKHFTCVGLQKNTKSSEYKNDALDFSKLAIAIKTERDDFSDDSELRKLYDREKMYYVDEEYKKFKNQKGDDEALIDELYSEFKNNLDKQYRLMPIKDILEYHQKYHIEKRNFNQDYVNWPLVNKEESIKFMLKMNPKILVH